mgnify:CR=1 FL=1
MQFDKPGRIFEAEQIAATLQKVGDEIIAEFREKTEDLLLLGIQRRGVPLANRLSRYIKEKLGVEIPVGTLDISMYRDDIGMRRTLPVIHETNIPDINGKTVILCDDVLQAGRTIRAALDAITDFGRPAIIRLAVLFDRGCHEFPIAADYTGMAISIPEGFKISVHWVEIDGSDFVKILEKKIGR